MTLSTPGSNLTITQCDPLSPLTLLHPLNSQFDPTPHYTGTTLTASVTSQNGFFVQTHHLMIIGQM